MTPRDIAKVLRDAADVIERNGWTQDQLYDVEAEAAGKDPKDCPVCLMGAINVASFGDPSWRGTPADFNEGAMKRLADWAALAAVDHLNDLYAGTAMEPVLSDWNDAPNRTQDQVTAFLRAAADKAAA